MAFPEPVITRISKQDPNRAILEVTSFGLHNGRDNNIQEIRLTGNARPATQRYGQTKSDRAKLEFYEQYVIVPLDANRPFRFEATAIDQRGERSRPKSYIEN